MASVKSCYLIGVFVLLVGISVFGCDNRKKPCRRGFSKHLVVELLRQKNLATRFSHTVMLLVYSWRMSEPND
jgi:hypothetical protein